MGIGAQLRLSWQEQTIELLGQLGGVRLYCCRRAQLYALALINQRAESAFQPVKSKILNICAEAALSHRLHRDIHLSVVAQGDHGLAEHVREDDTVVFGGENEIKC